MEIQPPRLTQFTDLFGNETQTNLNWKKTTEEKNFNGLLLGQTINQININRCSTNILYKLTCTHTCGIRCLHNDSDSFSIAMQQIKERDLVTNT